MSPKTAQSQDNKTAAGNTVAPKPPLGTTLTPPEGKNTSLPKEPISPALKEEKPSASEKKEAKEQAVKDMEKLRHHILMVGVALGDPVPNEDPNIAERRKWAARTVILLEEK